MVRWRVTVTCNLPYYITSPILEKTLTLCPDLSAAVFMGQKEVAERITAQPGTRDWGYLSVQTQLQSNAELLFTIPASAFHPPPKVDSAVVRLQPRDLAAGLGIGDREQFLRFIALCFHQKRKTLRNNLAARYGAAVDAWPEAGLRAEQVDLATFAALYRRLVT